MTALVDLVENPERTLAELDLQEPRIVWPAEVRARQPLTETEDGECNSV